MEYGHIVGAGGRDEEGVVRRRLDLLESRSLSTLAIRQEGTPIDNTIGNFTSESMQVSGAGHQHQLHLSAAIPLVWGTGSAGSGALPSAADHQHPRGTSILPEGIVIKEGMSMAGGETKEIMALEPGKGTAIYLYIEVADLKGGEYIQLYCWGGVRGRQGKIASAPGGALWVAIDEGGRFGIYASGACTVNLLLIGWVV